MCCILLKLSKTGAELWTLEIKTLKIRKFGRFSLFLRFVKSQADSPYLIIGYNGQIINESRRKSDVLHTCDQSHNVVIEQTFCSPDRKQIFSPF